MRYETETGLTIHHTNAHNRNTPWSCECGKVFSSKYQGKKSTRLNRLCIQHLLDTCSAHPDVTKNLPFECRLCKMRLLTKRALDIHVGAKHADHYYSCDKCGMRHANKMLHLRHVGRCDKDHFCKNCSKTFKSETELTFHIRNYCRIKSCEFCDETFANQDLLSMHQKTPCFMKGAQRLVVSK